MRIVKLAIEYNISTKTLIKALINVYKSKTYTKMSRLNNNEISLIRELFSKERDTKNKAQNIKLPPQLKEDFTSYDSIGFFRFKSKIFHFTYFEKYKFSELVDEYDRISDEIELFERDHGKIPEIKESGEDIYYRENPSNFDIKEFDRLLGIDDEIENEKEEKIQEPIYHEELQAIIDKKKELLKLEYLFNSSIVFNENYIFFNKKKYNIKTKLSKTELRNIHLALEYWADNKSSNTKKNKSSNNIYDYHFAPNSYCSSCQETPCMCSDPEKTSSTWLFD